MIEQDTIRLLRECDAGIQMGVSSIEQVLEHVTDDGFRRLLEESRQAHEGLDTEIRALLDRYHDEGKEPGPIAKGMSRMKTGVKIGMDESDETIADIMTEGCNMGVKSLSRYLNQYQAADESSKDITKRLIQLESRLAVDIRPYL